MRILKTAFIILGGVIFCYIAFCILSILGGKALAWIELPSDFFLPLCNASAILVSAIVAFIAFEHNRLNSQEPLTIILRELHKEFWNDKNFEIVRKWLCSDDSFDHELKDVLCSRNKGPASSNDYPILELLDKYCAFMSRVYIVSAKQLTDDQKKIIYSLGYDWWLCKTNSRPEIMVYIQSFWPSLVPFIHEAEKRDDEKSNTNVSSASNIGNKDNMTNGSAVKK